MRTRKAQIALGLGAALACAATGALIAPATADAFRVVSPRSESALGSISTIDEAADSVHDFLSASIWRGYSSIEITDRKRLVVYGADEPPEAIWKEALALAAPYPVEHRASKIRLSEFEERVDSFRARLTENREYMKAVRQIAPADGDRAVYVELQDVEGVEWAEELAREVFAGLPLEIEIMPADSEPIGQPMAGRWDETSP